MKVSANIKSNFNHHDIVVQTDETAKELQISPKPSGYGSSVNGGELLLLSLATCYCNDIYREAGKRNIVLSGVEVIFNGEFDAEGGSGSNINYSVKVLSDVSAAEINDLITYTDQIAEIHNTLRKGVSVTLNETVPEK